MYMGLKWIWHYCIGSKVKMKKAVYTTTSVGWVEAVTQMKSPFGVFLHLVTDKQTDGGDNP